jgi:membrane-associated phospholipid phosphatase
LTMTPRKGWLIGSAACALALYALLWVGWAAQWQWIGAMDRSLLEPLHSYGVDRPGWVTGWDIFCTVFGPTVFRLATIVVIIVALVRRNVRMALFLVISIELCALVTEAAKAAAGRPRPIDAFASGWGLSFPSGHALGLMVIVLALLTISLPVVRRPMRIVLIVIGIVVVVVVGFGRVVLNVHHPSDVLAGWALGYVWFVVCLLAVPPVAPITAADEIPAAPGSSP